VCRLCLYPFFADWAHPQTSPPASWPHPRACAYTQARCDYVSPRAHTFHHVQLILEQRQRAPRPLHARLGSCAAAVRRWCSPHSCGRTAPTPHSARDVSSRLALRIGALVVPACALACAPAPPPPHIPRASSPICAALRPPPAKSGEGGLLRVHLLRCHGDVDVRPWELGRGRTGQRLGRGWGGGRAADADARPAVRRVRRVWRAVGVERPASANVVSVRRGGEEAQYARLYGDAGGYAGATPILHPYALLGLG
jgi:hypothetical protein